MAGDVPADASDAVDGGGEGPPRSPGRDLRQAILSGLGLAALFLVALLLSPLALLTLVVALVVVALFELDRALRSTGAQPATPVVAGAAVVICYGSYLHGAPALAVGLVLALLGSVAWTLLAGRSRPTPAGGFGDDLAASALVVCWVPLLAGFVGLLVAREHGEWYVLAVIALTVTNDIGAYAFGRRFGRSKLAPTVSPAKTWEGLVGGLATVLVLAGLVTAVVPGFTLGLALTLAVAVVLAATVGDLTESMIKRDLGLKDLGGAMPGHGGVMDRVDAIVFALPTAHIVLRAFGL